MPVRAKRELVCARDGCGEAFRPWNTMQRFCSRACAAEVSRGKPKITPAGRAKLSAERSGPGNPRFKHGGRVGKNSRPGQRRFVDEVRRCRAPGCSSRPDHQHHVVYRQHVRGEQGDVWAQENALALCASCHHSHHARGRVLPVSALRDENVRWAVELLGGDRAVEYLRRYYLDDRGAGWWFELVAGLPWIERTA